MHQINIKPLSVNKAWRGKLSKTPTLMKYNRDIGLILPRIKVPEGFLRLSIEFGFSSKASDIDNPLKPFIDCLQNKYGFDDKNIYELAIKKEVVKRGNEYIKFNLESIS